MLVKDRKLRMLLPLFYYTKTLDFFNKKKIFLSTPGWEMDSSEASHWQDTVRISTLVRKSVIWQNQTLRKKCSKTKWRAQTSIQHQSGEDMRTDNSQKYTTRAEQMKQSVLQRKIVTLKVNICWMNASVSDLFLSPNCSKKSLWF